MHVTIVSIHRVFDIDLYMGRGTVFFLGDVFYVFGDEVEVGVSYFYVSGFWDRYYNLEIIVVIVFGFV